VGDLSNPRLTVSTIKSGWISIDSHDHNVNHFLTATISDDNGFKADITHGAAARHRLASQSDLPVLSFVSNTPLQAQQLKKGDCLASMERLKVTKGRGSSEYSNWDGKRWDKGTYEINDLVLIDLRPEVELRRATTRHCASQANEFVGLHGKSDLSKLVLRECGCLQPMFTADSTADAHHVLADKELSDKYLLANSAYLLGVKIQRDVLHLGKNEEADQKFRTSTQYTNKLFRSVGLEFPDSVLECLCEAVVKLHRPERNGRKREGGHGGYTAGDREQKKPMGRVDELLATNDMPVNSMGSLLSPTPSVASTRSS
jgi:hypothetical protein